MFRRLGPLRVALLYALFGSLWIVTSDQIASAFFPSNSEMVFVQTLKGLLFITVSSLFVYLLTRYAVRHLQRGETRYRELFENHPDALFVLDIGGRIQDANHAASSLYGYERSELMKMVADDLLASVGPNQGFQWLSGNLADRASFETRHRRRDQTLIDVEISALPIKLDGHACLIACVRDVSARKQAEASLHESERRLMTLMSNLPGMAYRCDNAPGWTMQFVSDGCRELVGCAAEDLLESRTYRYADFIHPDDRQTVWDEVQRCVRERRPFELTYRIRTVSDTEKWVWERGRGVHDEAGDLIALEGLITDITPLKNAERQRESLEKQLRQAQKMEAIGQLAGGVAHDFNNILTAILGNVELCISWLKSADKPRDTLIESMEHVEEGARRAAGLTRQLLAFSRHQVTQPAILDLNEVLKKLDNMLRRLIRENITLEMMTDPQLHRIYADRGQIEQVVINLVVNAADAMKAGGRLTIETSNVTLDESYVASHAEAMHGPHVMLAVNDTGQGMSADTIEHIFEPFFTTKPVGQGTGLGLSTVYGIVKQAGGDVSVYSEPGRGSRFKVFLPVAQGEAGPSPVPDEDEITGGSETLLLCEDDPAVRSMTERMLSTAGYTVLPAANGQEALEIAEKHQGTLHLVVTDVIIPDMNGRELAEALRRAQPGMPVLFISGYSASVIANHGVLETGVHFLEKPFTYDDLLRHVRKALEPVHS